jgi:hypothetical protein
LEAIRHKADLARMVAPADKGGLELIQGPSVSAVWLLSQFARDLGIVAALGSDRQGKLALWQVIPRVLDQGSRLSAVRLAGGHAAGAALGMISFDEADLYANLDWLANNQADIEPRLFGRRTPASAPDVFLYDVTSTYLEGEHNAFAAFGYNRDRKSGKRQIVIGLLCDADGRPLSIELFAGNTSDVKTFSSQLSNAAARLGAERVTFVGDRSMIKAPQRAEPNSKTGRQMACCRQDRSRPHRPRNWNRRNGPTRRTSPLLGDPHPETGRNIGRAPT